MDPPGNAPVSYSVRPGTLGHFGTGTYAQSVIPAIDHGLDYIGAIGVPAIQSHAQSLIAPLCDGIKAKGYTIITPPGTKTPILTALHPQAKARLSEPMAKAQVRISLHDQHFRIAPSVFNDMADVDRLLAALPRA
jgi:selenocysteine lyase/cysteine desulfurase